MVCVSGYIADALTGTSHFVYLSYTHKKGPSMTEVYR